MHRCPYPSCITQVPTHLLMCKKHWAELPHHHQKEIYRLYRVGIRDNAHPSKGYITYVSNVLAELRADSAGQVELPTESPQELAERLNRR